MALMRFISAVICMPSCKGEEFSMEDMKEGIRLPMNMARGICNCEYYSAQPDLAVSASILKS